MKRVKINFKENNIAQDVVVADSFFARARGLMFRKKMDNFDGMLITPCNSIHTFGMFFPIDVIFLNKNFEVIKVMEGLKPNRMTLLYLKASQVLELAAGTLAGKVTKGDCLEITCIN